MKRMIRIGLTLVAIGSSLGLIFQNCGSGFDVNTADNIRSPQNNNTGSGGLPGDGLNPGGEGQESVLHFVSMGDLLPTPDAETQDIDISGRAMMVRKGDGSTEVYVTGNGFPPGTTLAAHVHNLPCSLGAGGHYKINPSVEGTVGNNELWPMVTSDAEGNGVGQVIVRNHIARSDAQSVVVHGGGGAKVACADLGASVRSTSFGGTFITLPPGTNLGLNVSGAALINRRGSGYTAVKVVASGLTPNTQYMAHLHALPCGTDMGGGHYKIDPTIAETIPENEIWPGFTTNSEGVGVSEVWAPHIARADGASVVIHNPGDGVKIACADLVLAGDFNSTATGLAKGVNILGRASLSREEDGSTTYGVTVSGLNPNLTYPAHVHNQPCYLGAGGHYKLDPKVTEVIAENEMWLSVKSNGQGQAVASVKNQHLARAEAVSIVIRDPADGAKIACADLP